ncbi:MAG: GNAT family N-acetyltransferase [Muribaculaceae bacterium]|nr:GNAT family N-acetyltransferase [Muribaculaceae bacterium]
MQSKAVSVEEEVASIPASSSADHIKSDIIAKVAREAIEAELTPDKLLRTSNKGENLIYIIDAHTSPSTMREIGRLREIAFRDAGGGTGLECDIDSYDLMDPPCRQLIVWDPHAREIVGGYRFILGKDIRMTAPGVPRIATSHMFRFSEKFINDYLPHTIELGRSFVATGYQSRKAGTKGLYALDNLWDGLGALTVLYPEIKYLFGKVTMYPAFGEKDRDLILGFMHKYFHDPDRLVWPIEPLPCQADSEEVKHVFDGTDFQQDYKILIRKLREHGKTIPPLINAYMALSPTMRVFGTAVNDEFGDVEETGIFMNLNEIRPEKKARHISTFHNKNKV